MSRARPIALFATPELVRGRGGRAKAAATCSWTKVLEASGPIFQIVSEAIRTNRTITAYEEEVPYCLLSPIHLVVSATSSFAQAKPSAPAGETNH
jgi:hypothetical protein